MFVGRKDIDEVKNEMEVIEKVEKSLGLLEHKIAKTFSAHHKFNTCEEAIKDVIEKHHHYKSYIEEIKYTITDSIVYVYVKLNKIINPASKVIIREDIKDNLALTKVKIVETVVHIYLDESEVVTNSSIFDWRKIEI